MRKPKRLIVARPTLGSGGADRVTITLLRHLPRDLFAPELALLRPEGELLRELPSDVSLSILGAASLWSAWLPLARLLRKRRPDVLLSTSSGMNAVATVASRLSGTRPRLVLSERGHLREELSKSKRLYRRIKKFLYPRADLITTVSQGVKDELVARLGLPEEAVAVVYNPVVEDRISSMAQENVDHPWFRSSVPVVLAVGRLVEEKDYPTLLRAFAQVSESTPAKLVILGTGPLHAQLMDLAVELGVDSDMYLAPFDPNPFRYMSRCSAFALSSRFEGLPGVLIQAMACGAAVVSTDCPSGPSEIIQSGVDGLLVPTSDPKALAGAIQRLLENPELRRSLGARARISAQRFSVERCLNRYVEALIGSEIEA